jgi:mono/diheme cytochrome c family protein
MSALIAYLGVLGTSAASVPEERPALLLKTHFDADRRRTAAKKSNSIAAASPDLMSNNSLAPTVPAIPLDTGSGKSIESVAAGQRLFLKRGCFTCHGRAGAGGLAPALAPLVAQLSDSQLTLVLESPTAKMKAGGMPPVQLTSEEMEMLLSYLRTLSISHAENLPPAKAVGP